VFDDFIAGTSSVYTAAQHNATLGQYDQMSIQAIVDKLSVSGGSPTLTVQIEHSADQRNWESKSGTAEINAAGMTAGTTNIESGYDAGTTPSHAFERLRIALGGTSPEGHVKIWITARDES
jgi:hypothetical protein